MDTLDDRHGPPGTHFRSGASAPAVFRTRPEIEGFFGGLRLVEPGLVDVGAWRSLRPSPPAPLRFLGGVARLIPGREQP